VTSVLIEKLLDNVCLVRAWHRPLKVDRPALMMIIPPALRRRRASIASSYPPGKAGAAIGGAS
jgi:hypothetical protein